MCPMRILNARAGFAANSSSSHSLLLFRSSHGETVDATSFLPDSGEELERGDFGWGYFIASSPEAKALYLAVQVDSALSYSVGPTVAARFLATLGLEPPPKGAYVDHQSRIELPSNWTRTAPNFEFLSHFVEYVRRPDVVIVGGNDNSDFHVDEADGFLPALDRVSFVMSNTVARYDREVNVWTLFSRMFGSKLRITFDPYNDPARGSLPELVDIKITDYCDFGCTFCYQGSTKRGKHASWEYLEKLAYALAEAQVFEVAIGGGEATQHPDFERFVALLAELGVVPNLTTRNIAYLASEPASLEHLGAVAVSVSSVDDLDAFLAIDDSVFRSTNTARHVHVIDGLVDAREFEAICRKAWDHQVRVTLLGYKTAGRGKRHADSLVPSGWLDLITSKDADRWLFSVDTALVRQYMAEIESLDVEPISYHSTEGAWSCYVDAPAGKIAPSSYGPASNRLDLSDPADLVERFRQLEVEDVEFVRPCGDIHSENATCWSCDSGFDSLPSGLSVPRPVTIRSSR